LTAVTWGQELATALKTLDIQIRDSESNTQLLAFANKIKSALRDVWKDASSDVFDIGFA
jgi:cohesin loading factor subunit SCC2